MYLSSTITLTDPSKPAKQNTGIDSSVLNSAIASSDALGNNCKTIAPISSACCRDRPTSRHPLLHLVKPRLAVLLIECIDDAPHNSRWSHRFIEGRRLHRGFVPSVVHVAFQGGPEFPRQTCLPSQSCPPRTSTQ